MTFVEFKVRGKPLASHSSGPCCLAQNVVAPNRAEPIDGEAVTSAHILPVVGMAAKWDGSKRGSKYKQLGGR